MNSHVEDEFALNTKKDCIQDANKFEFSAQTEQKTDDVNQAA